MRRRGFAAKHHTGTGCPPVPVARRAGAYHPRMTFRVHVIARIAAVAFALLPGPVLGQVFKCVDGAGRVTYQESPCNGNTQGGRVELPLDAASTREAPEVEARWRESAMRHEVTKGMPKRWVQQALGVPAQIRRAVSDEGATEIWTYDTPGGTVNVGFAANVVAWQRNEPRASNERAQGADAARSRVAAERNCDEVLKELGAPSTRDNIKLTTTGSDSVRYTYDPIPGGLPVRLSFTCSGGRVIAVSRGIPR
jgi:Domain of unknown function (DUF4124)